MSGANRPRTVAIERDGRTVNMSLKAWRRGLGIGPSASRTGIVSPRRHQAAMAVVSGHLHGAAYELPDAIADAWTFLERVDEAWRAAHVETPPVRAPAPVGDLAVYLEATVDATMSREETERRRRLRLEAAEALVERAQNSLIDAVRATYDDVIAALAVALAETLDSVRKVAPAFDGIAPDDGDQVLRAGIVSEFRKLEAARDRQDAIRAAQENLDIMARDRPGPDSDMFSEFRAGIPRVWPAWNVETARPPWPDDAPLGRLLWLAGLEPGAVWVPTVAEANAAAAKWRAERQVERERRAFPARRVAAGL